MKLSTPAPQTIVRSKRPVSVARRILMSFTLVLLACAVTMAWSIYAQHRASEESALLRTGYVPLLLSLGSALETQNLVSAQLNHITEAKNPSDAWGWMETQRRLRPLSFAAVRSAIDRGLGSRANARARAMGHEIAFEVGDTERFLAADGEQLTALFEAIGRGDRTRAEDARAKLLQHELEGSQRLRELSRKVERAMDELSAYAALRERRAIQLLLILAAGTLTTGVGIALYVRRVLAPLARMTDRAKAVAHGDLTPRPVVASPDEIGELATTFEQMVTAISRARGELVQAERLAAVGRMAAHVTHEIRNPISAMGLNVELLEEELATLSCTEETRELVSAIRVEVERLSALSEQYLGLVRRPAPALTPGDVGDFADEVLQFARLELQRALIEVRLSRDESLPDVKFDESQLRQALLNLIRNAREAMPEGGQLRIAVHQAPQGGVELFLDDTGQGVSQEVRASLFDPFFTTKKQGTGLGLAITREIVEAHGGTIVCEPLSAQGTRFRLWLPAAP